MGAGNLILTSYPCESPELLLFIDYFLQSYDKETKLVVLGDFVNFFHFFELEKKSVLSELFSADRLDGDLEMLCKGSFSDAALLKSRLPGMLKECLLPHGKRRRQLLLTYGRRYGDLAVSLSRLFGALPADVESKGRVFFVPGPMDCPWLLEHVLTREGLGEQCRLSAAVEHCWVSSIPVGFVPASPPNPGVLAAVDRDRAGPNVVDEAEFARQLRRLWGVELLVTHVHPEESPALMDFLLKSPLQCVVCAAPVELGARDRRLLWGRNELLGVKNKSVVKVGGFHSGPKGRKELYMMELSVGNLSTLDLPIKVISWNVN